MTGVARPREIICLLYGMAFYGALSLLVQNDVVRKESPDDVLKHCKVWGDKVQSDNEADVISGCENMAAIALDHLDDKYLAYNCMRPMQDILHNAHKGPWLAKTRAQDAIMKLAKRYADDRDFQYNFVFMIGGTYGVPPEVTVRTSQLGGFVHLFNVIKHFHDDTDLQMQAYRALSDPSYTPSGADAIANGGGPYEGIKFMVQQMKDHPKGHQAESPTDHLDLLYEIMQVSAGTLFMHGEEYAPVYMQEGFADQIVHAMEVEHDLRGTQDVACKCMTILAHTPSFAIELMDKGAVQLMKKGMDTFHDYNSTYFTAGHTIAMEYPVTENCVDTLSSMAKADPAKAQKLMQQAGLEKTLKSIRPNMLSGETLVSDGSKLRKQVAGLLHFLNIPMKGFGAVLAKAGLFSR